MDHFHGVTAAGRHSKAFLKALRRDSTMLASSLPEGIVVHTYESRPDLFRVVIVGPEGTPFVHSLFFFDVSLPAEYPSAPPSVHFRCPVEERLHPNLYTDGKVCLSLLGTWNGKGSETWTSDSTLLQLLVSIQGLILVPFPYFNEAGFEKFVGTEQGDHLARSYNENSFLLTMQAMAALAARPPEDFKDHVAQHVAIAGPRLVAMCNSLLAHSASLATSGTATSPDATADSASAGGGSAGAGSGSAGSGVGSPGVCEDLADVFPHPCCSKGFTQVLTKLMPSLTLRFTPGPL